MSDVPAVTPEGYEILRTVDASGSGGEYIARYLPDDVLIMLRIFSFAKSSGATTRRHLREHLRCDISFMEELEHPRIISIFDYSDTKKLFWMATQPAEVNRLSKCFDILASEPFHFRQTIVHDFLDTLQHIHDKRVVHRNLSGDAVFLDSESRIYIGDFGLAEYLTNQSATSRDTTFVTTMSYQPPEVRNAQTFACDVSCDIFSAGMLAFEILSATALPKDNPDRINEMFCTCLNEQVAKGIIENDTAEVISKAVNPSPEKRWSTAKDFAYALERSVQGQLPYGSVSLGATSAPDVTKPIASVETAPLQTASDMADKPSGPKRMPSEATESITPLDPSHEIWNNHYEIIEKIGEGGQAVVYKAHDHLTNEEIAIKTIWSRHRTDRAAINRLKQGAMIARSLTHRYIIRTYSVEQRIDADDTSKYVFICMELIKSQLELGHVIENRRAAGQKFRLNEVLYIVRQLLNALAYAHEYTIHRDIKPGNIMLVPHDEQAEVDSSDLTKFDIRLIDFGIAKVLSQKHIDVTGKGFRSAHYGAPELADIKTGVDARADIYSVGVMMYQMLTMNIPRKGSPPANKVNKEVPVALAKVIDKAINADREKRFKTISEFAKEINKAVSKFNWLRKAAKIAAVLVVGACIVGTVKYLLPQPDYGSVRQTVEILKDRIPGTEIATLAQGSVVTYSDIEGCEAYEGLRQAAIEKLEVVELAGSKQFNKRSFLPWKQQEEAWTEMESAARKLQRIGQDHRQYNARKDLAVASHLMQLAPSSEIVSDVRARADKAEKLLEARPFSRETLDVCVDPLDLGARLYQNIEVLAGGLDTLDTAVQINDQARKVKQSRNNFLLASSSLDMIKPLKDYSFDERRVKCLEKADRYYRSFELSSATKYLNLLNQICGTVSDVKGQIDFGSSDIDLIVSRLMDLCYEDVEAFDDYPEWKGKLERVHKKKDLLARYITLLEIIEVGPKHGIPEDIYVSLLNARKERDDVQAAKKRLSNAASEYKRFLTEKVNNLEALSTTRKDIENHKNQLQKLRSEIAGSEWPEVKHVQKYKEYSDDVKNSLMKEGSELRRNIVDKVNSVQVEYIWESGINPQYMSTARSYTSSGIMKSIDDWKHIDNIQRISSIIIQMRDVDVLLTRKQKLDRLAGKIDEGIDLGKRSEDSLPEEKEEQFQLLAQLRDYREKLTKKDDNKFLIDQNEEQFNTEYKSLSKATEEIINKLKYRSKRVEQLIDEADFIESTGKYINGTLGRWRNVITQDRVAKIIFQSSNISDELESIKADVDIWPKERFKREIKPKCMMFERTISQESQAVLTILRAIKALDERINNILSNEDIRELNDIAAQNDKKTILEELTDSFNRSRDVLKKIQDASENVSLADEHADFVISTWIGNYNKTRAQLEKQITQLQTIEKNISKDVAELLTQELPIEQSYYADLKIAAVKVMGTHYSNIENEIKLVENNSSLMKMYDFLEKMGDNTIPKLMTIRQSHSDNNTALTKIQSFAIEDLSTVKEFNICRKELVQQFAILSEALKKYNESDLESACKKTVLDAPNHIRQLIEKTSNGDKIGELCTSLWSFYFEHKDWDQWQHSFQELFHITISSDDQLQFTSLHGFQPTDKNGNVVVTSMVVSNPTDFFHIDIGKVINFGWPKYAKADVDPSVKLKFVPSGTGSPEPFYMATYEITNAQYKRFLIKTAAKPSKMKNWSHFLNQDNQTLLQWTPFDGEPQCNIRLDDNGTILEIAKGKEDSPVTWVTYSGAQSYAKWFDGRLPTPSQHEYACRAGTTSLYPWGDNLSPISNFAHVRSVAWQYAASEYNSQIDNPVEIARAPVGAVTDFQDENKTLDTSKLVHNKAVYNSVWPISNAHKPNNWGLYDMIGNVWEWCKNDDDEGRPVICGGSCLSPPEYTYPDSKYKFKGRACDVGFRVVIPVQ
jgi:serine/threonine protein kinase/formylglycine-generating enzyme required for sulfatase activity